MNATTKGSLGRWARTLGPVAPRQILARVRIVAWRRLIGVFPALCALATKKTAVAPSFQFEALAGLVAVAGRLHPDPIAEADAACERRFRYLNVERQFGGRIDWSPPGAELLWTYHLHYADWARSLALAFKQTRNTKYYRAFRWLCEDWMANNLPGRSVGWWPFPVAVRLVNWSLAAAAFVGPMEGDTPFQTALQQSLRGQAWFMIHSLETDVGGNHLIKDLTGLIVAGTFLGGATSAKWTERIARRLQQELGKQILDDGGHYEQSPYYHAMVLEDLEAVATLPHFRENSSPWLHAAIAHMARFLAGVVHPDGDVPFFNDSQLLGQELVAQLCHGLTVADKEPAFPDTGFYVLSEDQMWAVAKVSQPCPRRLPAHAHCDVLSYEYSWTGLRFIVNGGTYTYQGPLRQWFRSTSAHNTGQVMDIDQSETWGQFRVGGRARLINVHSVREESEHLVYGAYRVAPGRTKDPLHERWLTRTGTALRVDDAFTVPPGWTAVVRVLFHPEVSVSRKSTHLWELAREERSVFLRTSTPGQITEAWWSPRFGEKTLTRQLVIPARRVRPGRLVAGHAVSVEPDIPTSAQLSEGPQMLAGLTGEI